MSGAVPDDRKAPAEDVDDGRLFVEPQTYRRRRVMASIRALPVLGVLLWAVPLLWGAGPDAPMASSALIYVFGVWIVLVILTAVMIRKLGAEPESGGAPRT